MARILSLDLETASALDLKKSGASRYARHVSTKVTVVAWAFDDGPVQSVTASTPDLALGRLPEEIVEHIKAGGTIRAWNAFFEYMFLREYFGIPVNVDQMSCTMQRSLHAGLPGALGDCGPALGLSIVKDVSAHRLMLQMARPRGTAPDGSLRWWHKEDAQKLSDLEAYCRRDVEAEREIARWIPELPASEKAVAFMDRRANMLGVRLDIPLIHRMIAVANDATTELNARCAELTGGEVTSPGTQSAKLVAWLSNNGVPIEGVGKDLVSEALKDQGLSPVAREVLEIRQQAAKSSVKKLKAMLDCVDGDGCVRGVLAYYGASRTGRFAGRLIQPQNFPRPTIKKPNEAISNIKNGMDAGGLSMFFGKPLDVLASCLRGTIIPGEHCTFVVYDLSQIEARMVAWLAGQRDILAVFAAGEDVYSYTAEELGLPSRQAGKACVLGLGFGLGKGKFVEFAATYGLTYSEAEAADIVSRWRERNSRIVQFWWDTDKAIKEAVRAFNVSNKPVERAINPRLSVTVSRAKNGSPLMTLLLPSGRRLFYRDIAITLDPETQREQVSYSGVDQITKKWGRVRSYGGKWVENATQAAARDVVVGMAMQIEAEGLGRLKLSVHDELIVEVPARDAELIEKRIKTIMNTAPSWAPGLPVAAEGHIMSRYGK